MKEYPEEYEKVFSDENRKAKFCKLEQVSFYQDNPVSISIFMRELDREMRAFEKDIFDHLVKITWLRRRFMYKGRRRRPHVPNGFDIERAYGIFMRSYMGFDLSYLTFRKNIFYFVESYIEEWFPRLDEDNPFEVRHEYPFSHVTFGFLLLVRQMDERMELLQIAEKCKFTLAQFMDYVVNYIGCLNEELERDKYEFRFESGYCPVIKKMTYPSDENDG